MKVIQTKISDLEYSLLRDYVEKTGMTIQDALHQAVREQILDDSIDADDPVFDLPRGGTPDGKKRDISGRVDELLYGPIPR